MDSELVLVDFGEAIRLLKNGKKLSRKGWNGSGMYAYYVPASSYPASTEIAKKEFGELVPYRPYLALKTAQNEIATWNPSTTDCLAEDWFVKEDTIIINSLNYKDILSNVEQEELTDPIAFMMMGETAFQQNVAEELRNKLSPTEKQMWISGYLLALTKQSKR